MAITEKSLGDTYEIMFSGVFGRLFQGSTTMLWKYLQEIAILLCLALALTPAFKMKFWNCGAEGQALMGGLASIFCMIEFGEKLPYSTLIIVIAVTSILAGAIWGVIPAIFKALFNTNETLFTLMMNYIATQIIAYYVYIEGGGSNVINPVSYGNFPSVGNNDYFVNIFTVAVITVLMYIYLKYSKQGYEISVVGGNMDSVEIFSEKFSYAFSKMKNLHCRIYLEKFAYAPVSKGTVVGHCDYYLGDELKIVKPIVITESVMQR